MEESPSSTAPRWRFWGWDLPESKDSAGASAPAPCSRGAKPSLKQFARESVEETVKLESALAKLRTPSKVVLMHYAPIVDTVRGEPAEIFAFLGSSRLEEPVNRYEVTALFHGHAHNGSPEGRTMAGLRSTTSPCRFCTSSFPVVEPCGSLKFRRWLRRSPPEGRRRDC